MPFRIPNSKKIILGFDRIIVACLCISFFCIPFAKAGVETFIWIAIFLWALKRAFGYRAQAGWGMLPATELNKALGVFILANIVSVVFSTHFGLSLRGLFGKELKFILIYFMLVETITSRKRLKVILTVIIASASLMVIDAAVQYYGGRDFLRGHAWARLSASFSSANGFAGWLIIITPLISGLLWTDKFISRWMKVLLSVLFVLLITCLLMTYTRGAWLGFIIGILLIGWYIFKNFNLRIKLLCLFLSVGLLAIFFISPQFTRKLLETTGDASFRTGITLKARFESMVKTSGGSTSVRLNLWAEGLNIVKDYPLTGCGLNAYSQVGKRYKKSQEGGGYPHNSYIQMAAEIGLLGLFAFLWVLYNFFRMGVMYFKKTKNYLVLGLLSGILAFLIHAFFDTHLYSLQLVVLFWFMLGLSVSIMKLEDNSFPAPS